MKKMILFLATCCMTYSNFAIWCIMEEVTSVDTQGNGGKACWVTGKMNGRTVTDILICKQTNEQANARNYATAITAFTSNAKLAFWTNDVTTCDDIPVRWFDAVTRVAIRK